MTGRRRGARTERGAAAVEFAFIAPILLFLLFAIVGYGYMLSFRQALSQGASEGARAAAVAPPGLPQTSANVNDDTVQKRVIAAVNTSLSSYGVTCSTTGTLKKNNVDVGTCVISFSTTCSASTATSGCAKVALDYLYKDNSLLPAVPGLGIVLPSHLKYTSEVELS